MAITFSSDIFNKSAEDKVREYNQLRQAGYSDAAIRQAAEAQLGPQSNADWSYVQGLATRLNSSPQDLANFKAQSPQEKVKTYLAGVASGLSDEQVRYRAMGLFGDYYSDSDWGAVRQYAQNLTPDQKAQVYKQTLSSGLSDAQIRANISQTLGQQSDADWQAMTNLANPQSGNTPANAGPPANPYTPQPLGNPFTYTPNPYLGEMAGTIRQQVTDNLQRNILPGIGSAAVAAGGYGGSRQGVVEANALKDANTGLSGALSNLYGQDYNNAMGRNLQRYGMDQGYNLGVGNLGLGFQNSNQNYALGLGNLGLGYQNSLQNFYTNQRGQDLQATQLGANLFQQGNTGMQQQGQGLYNLGLTQQQAPWSVVGNYTNTLSPFTGFGNTSTSTPGNALAGGLGGAVVGAQLYNLFNKP